MKIATQLQLAKALKADGNYSVGHGLYMSVRGGSTRWVFRYKAGGKLKEMPVGTYPLMTLAQARLEADGHRRVLKVHKCDPATVAKHAARLALIDGAAPSFRQDALTYHAHVSGEWRSDAYRKDWLASLERYVYPALGDCDTAKITVSDIVKVIEPIWGKLTIADLILDRIRLVIDHAADTDDLGRFEHGNPATRVRKRLPKGVQPKAKAHGSLPWEQAPTLYSKLVAVSERHPGKAMAAKALRFLLLCCCPRAGEVKTARWSEIVDEPGLFNALNCSST